MLDLRVIEARHRMSEGFNADAAYAAQALVADDIPALIAEVKRLRKDSVKRLCGFTQVVICAHCGGFMEVVEEIFDCGTQLKCHCGEQTVVSLETPEEYTWHVNAWANRDR